MPRSRNRSPINHRSRFGAWKSRDRSRVRRRSPSMDRIRLERRQQRRSRRAEMREMSRVRARSPSPANCIGYSQWFCLGVFGMSNQTTESDLRRIFQRYGPIERVRIIYDPKTRESRGFGFVYLRHKQDALIAKDRCDGMLFDRRNIRVDLSRTEKPHSPTPGQYMGPDRRIRRERKQQERRSALGCRVVRRIPMERKSPSPIVPFVHPRFRPVGSRSGSSES